MNSHHKQECHSRNNKGEHCNGGRDHKGKHSGHKERNSSGRSIQIEEGLGPFSPLLFVARILYFFVNLCHLLSHTYLRFQFCFISLYISFRSGSNRIELMHGCILMVGPKVEAVARAYEFKIPQACISNRRRRDGDASHITLIHGAQLKALEKRDQITRDQILEIVRNLVKDPGMWHCHGLGKAESEIQDCSKDENGESTISDKNEIAENQRTQASFFAVISWPEGEAVLRYLKLPPRCFHLTIGFSAHDIHGVPKDLSTLFLNDTAIFCDLDGTLCRWLGLGLELGLGIGSELG
jgi:hypothetical protein